MPIRICHDSAGGFCTNLPAKGCKLLSDHPCHSPHAEEPWTNLQENLALSAGLGLQNFDAARGYGPLLNRMPTSSEADNSLATWLRDIIKNPGLTGFLHEKIHRCR